MSSFHSWFGHVKNYQIQSEPYFIIDIKTLPYSILTISQNNQVQSLFANKFNRKYNDFSEDLLRYSTIVAPLIRSLWSLEAAHANAADVFIFWLASAATLKKLFDEDIDKTGIPQTLANEVTEIYNKRYEEFFKNDIYFVAFLATLGDMMAQRFCRYGKYLLTVALDGNFIILYTPGPRD